MRKVNFVIIARQISDNFLLRLTFNKYAQIIPILEWWFLGTVIANKTLLS